MKALPKHYSGDKSKEFWRRVNMLPNPQRETMYACGVLLLRPAKGERR